MKIKDLDFEKFISEEEIKQKIASIAETIDDHYKEKTPVFLPILNGSFMFGADLLKQISIPCRVSFVKISSYVGTVSSGQIKTLIGLDESLFNQHILIVEDIIDTGLTLQKIVEELKSLGTKSVEVISLLRKKPARDKGIVVKYLGFEIESEFVVGYGLDYDGLGRNLKEIYKTNPENISHPKRPSLKIVPGLLYSSPCSNRKTFQTRKQLTIYMINIILFGPPGAGKGTQSAKIIEKYSLLHIATGDLFRKHLKEGTPLGNLAKEYMNKGNLVPDQVVIDMVDDKIKSAENTSGIIFDGFPRTIPQAEALDKLLTSKGAPIKVLIELVVPEDELRKRLADRAMKENRPDDAKPEVIENRIAVYKGETAAVADYYKNLGKYASVVGVGQIENIFSNICREIDKSLLL